MLKVCTFLIVAVLTGLMIPAHTLLWILPLWAGGMWIYNKNIVSTQSRLQIELIVVQVRTVNNLSIFPRSPRPFYHQWTHKPNLGLRLLTFTCVTLTLDNFFLKVDWIWDFLHFLTSMTSIFDHWLRPLTSSEMLWYLKEAPIYFSNLSKKALTLWTPLGVYNEPSPKRNYWVLIFKVLSLLKMYVPNI